MHDPFMFRMTAYVICTTMLIVLLLSLPGCASIMNDDIMKVRIITFPPDAKVQVEHDYNPYVSPATVVVSRSAQDLHITVSRDYDDVVYIDFTDTMRSYPRVRNGIPRAGDIRTGGSLALGPIIPGQYTWFNIDTGGAVVHSGGLFSIMGSVDYFYTDRSFLSLTSGFAANVIGECFDSCGPHTRIVYAALTNGYNWNDVWLSVGMQVTHATFALHKQDNPAGVEILKSDLLFGARLSSAYRFSRYVYAALNYTPNFYSVQHDFDPHASSFITLGLCVMSGEGSPFP